MFCRYNCEPREWDRRLVKLSLIFAKAAAILRPKVELGRITVAWRRRLDKIAELRAAGTIAAARSAAHEASTRILDQNADGKTDFAEASFQLELCAFVVDVVIVVARSAKVSLLVGFPAFRWFHVEICWPGNQCSCAEVLGCF